MANGHGQRARDEEEQIESTMSEGWELLDDPPEWVVDEAETKDFHRKVGFDEFEIYHEEEYVYRVEATVHNVGLRVYRKPASEYDGAVGGSKPPSDGRGGGGRSYDFW